MTNLVVYTALFGDTEKLVEQDVASASTARFICFTDNPALTSSTWEVVHVEPRFPADPRRSQRDIKIRGHELLHGFDVWLYMDNTVKLSVTPEALAEEWLGDADWAAIQHDSNTTLWEEFDANLQLKKDTPERINEQLQDYSTFYRDVLDQRPLWNGIFVRRNNASVNAFGELWFEHVLRYSGRDQLSMLIALSHVPLSVNRLDVNVRRSPWHSWPHRDGETEKSKATRHAKTSGLKDLADELTEARNRIEALESENQRLRDRRWFGFGGVLRRVSEERRRRRRQKRQAQKRS